MLFIKKAIAGNYWDIYYNHVFLERHLTKWEAKEALPHFEKVVGKL